VIVADAAICSHQALSPAIWRLTLAAPGIAAAVRPGQFVHVALPQFETHVLRRPFYVYGADPAEGFIDLVYQALGEGTRRLSQLTAGHLSVLGPLGHGFAVPEGASRVLLVGGGLGAAPLHLLANSLCHPERSEGSIPHLAGTQVDVVLGAQTASALVGVADFTALAGPGHVHLATDDGSAGVHGFTTAVAERLLAERDYDYVATCGPQPMQQAIARLAAAAGVTCDVSLERRMACGVGVCLSCVVETAGGRPRACVEGPVFRAAEVVW
jgi:dihydroorotate dehydrogenase electron transfer subunit